MRCQPPKTPVGPSRTARQPRLPSEGSEALAYSLGEETPPDLFESFNAGTDTPAGGWTDLVQPTPWPDAVPTYRPAAQAALAEFGRLGRRLDTMLGEVLGLPELAARSVNGPDMLACIDYRPGPDGSESVVDGQLRMGAHSDYTTYTLLLADPVPGLQIVGSDGAWIDVIPAAGNLLMNVGDLLAIWTNDAWPSTSIGRSDGPRRRRTASLSCLVPLPRP